jgi:RNase adaptor protein for sRNA GlmZ degradation
MLQSVWTVGRAMDVGNTFSLPGQLLGEEDEFVQTELRSGSFPTLVLISHSHSPPLNPPASLSFDLRALANPPKYIRDAHNGTSKRLREWLNHDLGFVARRDAIRMLIVEAMEEFDTVQDEEINASSKVEIEDSKDEETDATQVQALEEETSEGSENELSSCGSAPSETKQASAQELRVGIYCQMGRHRSVAMVEELARMKWPEWDVRVEHRDVLKKRGKHKSAGRHGRGKGSSGRFMEEDW